MEFWPKEFYGALTIFPPYQSMQDFADTVFDDVSRLELCPAVDPRQRGGGDNLFTGKSTAGMARLAS